MLLASVWWLEDHEASPTQARLADHAAADPMMTSQVIRRLEARGLVERRVDPADARARRIAVTAPGRALLARALVDVEAVDAAYFAALGKRQPAFTADLQTLATTPGRAGTA